MKVVAIVGMPGSGKTVVSNYLRSKGFPVVSFGAVILAELQHRGWPLNLDNERVVREDLRRKHGMDVCAALTLPRIRAELARHPVVVIDGLYSWSEYKTLKREFGDALVVVAIVAPRALRYARLASRNERPHTETEAADRDWHEIEVVEKGGPIAIADFTVANDGSPQDLFIKIDDLITSARTKGS